MSVIKRDMAEEDKLEMARLFLNNKSNTLTQDKASAGGMYIRLCHICACACTANPPVDRTLMSEMALASGVITLLIVGSIRDKN